MLATKIENKKREDGFTLIELLVVVLIIGILAAIAIPAFLSQRERAWEAELTSNVRNAALEIEAFATAEGSVPDDLSGISDDQDTNTADVKPFVEDVLGSVPEEQGFSYATDDTEEAFSLCGTDDRPGETNTVEYSSNGGGILDELDRCA